MNIKNTEDIKEYIEILSRIENSTVEIKDILNSIKESKKEINSKGNLSTYLSLYKLVNKIQKSSISKSDTIKSIAKLNNGIVTTRMIEPLCIGREFLTYLVNKEELEKVERGIYQLKDTNDDKFFEIAYKYKKVVFSHMCALYLYNLSEQIPYSYTVTVPSGYHIDGRSINSKVYYIKKDNYELGITKVSTTCGNLVKAYDIERCICDIIKSKKIDPEQVKKSVKEYLKRKDKDLNKLSIYSKKLKCYERVMEYIGLLNE